MYIINSRIVVSWPFHTSYPYTGGKPYWPSISKDKDDMGCFITKKTGKSDPSHKYHFVPIFLKGE